MSARAVIELHIVRTRGESVGNRIADRRRVFGPRAGIGFGIGIAVLSAAGIDRFPLVGFTITNSNFFQSIDKPFIAIITSLSRQVIFLLPMIYIIPLIFERFSAPGLMGIWTACAISDVLGAILAAILLSTQLNVFRKKSNFDEI